MENLGQNWDGLRDGVKLPSANWVDMSEQIWNLAGSEVWVEELPCSLLLPSLLSYSGDTIENQKYLHFEYTIEKIKDSWSLDIWAKADLCIIL